MKTTDEHDMDESVPDQYNSQLTEQKDQSSQPFEGIKWVEDDEPIKEWPIDGVDQEVPMADTGNVGSGFFQQGTEEWKETQIGTLPSGNKLYVTKKKDGHGYVITQKPGSVPKALEGMYTSYSVAEREARIYISKKLDEHNAKVASK